MRRVMNSIDVRHRAGLMRQTSNGFHIVDCSDRVGGISGGDNLGSRIDLARQIVRVERAVFFVNVSELDLDSAFFEGPPRRDVGIVIQMGYDDLVPRAKFAAY